MTSKLPARIVKFLVDKEKVVPARVFSYFEIHDPIHPLTWYLVFKPMIEMLMINYIPIWNQHTFLSLYLKPEFEENWNHLFCRYPSPVHPSVSPPNKGFPTFKVVAFREERYFVKFHRIWINNIKDRSKEPGKCFRTFHRR